MNTYACVFICFVIQVVSVKCECDDYFKCIGEFISEFIGGVANDDTKIDFVNRTDLDYSGTIGVGGLQNKSTGFFNILDLEKGLDKVLEDVTGLLKDEIEKNLKLQSESEAFKTVHDASEIHVKTFAVVKKPENIENHKEIVQQILAMRSNITDDKSRNSTKNNNYNSQIETSGFKVNNLSDIENIIIVKSRTKISTNDTEPIITALKAVKPKSEVKKNISYKIKDVDIDRNITTRPEISLNKLPNDTITNDADTQLVTSRSEIMITNLGNYTESTETITEAITIRSEIKINESDDTDNKTTTQIVTSAPKIITTTFVPNETNNYETSTEIVTDLSETIKHLSANATENETIYMDQAKSVLKIHMNNITVAKIMPSTLSETINPKNTNKIESLDTLKNTTGNINTENINNLKQNKTSTKNVAEIIGNLIANENSSATEHSTTYTQEVLTIITTTKNTKPTETETQTSIPFKPLIDPLNYLSTVENEITDYSDLDYLIADDNSTDYPIVDYVELYKDTTNEDVYYIPTEIPEIAHINRDDGKADLDNNIEYSVIQEEVNNAITYSAQQRDTNSTVFPWIATIFVKSDSTDQFNYFCDGALLSENVVLTGARCVLADAGHAGNFIIFLGKRSLQATTDGETLHKVKEVFIHENYTNDDGNAKNDLAILVLEDPATFSDRIQPACVQGVQDLKEAVTTAWAPSGDLTIIHFEKEKTIESGNIENTFCATYGNDVALCPSHGGVYADKQTDNFCLQGIRSDDPTNKGFCIDKTVLYTSLNAYTDWINEKVDLNKLRS